MPGLIVVHFGWDLVVHFQWDLRVHFGWDYAQWDKEKYSMDILLYHVTQTERPTQSIFISYKSISMSKAKADTESLCHHGSIMTIFCEKKQLILLLKAPFYKLLSTVSTKSADALLSSNGNFGGSALKHK